MASFTEIMIIAFSKNYFEMSAYIDTDRPRGGQYPTLKKDKFFFKTKVGAGDV